ncbi:hypothetical protein VTK26DRAFT_1800 [Humicola hyalothermophila]
MELSMCATKKHFRSSRQLSSSPLCSQMISQLSAGSIKAFGQLAKFDKAWDLTGLDDLTGVQYKADPKADDSNDSRGKLESARRIHRQVRNESASTSFIRSKTSVTLTTSSRLFERLFFSLSILGLVGHAYFGISTGGPNVGSSVKKALKGMFMASEGCCMQRRSRSAHDAI